MLFWALGSAKREEAQPDFVLSPGHGAQTRILAGGVSSLALVDMCQVACRLASHSGSGQAAPPTGLSHVSLSNFKQEFGSFQRVFSDTSSLAACGFLEPLDSHKRELSAVTKSDLPLTHRLCLEVNHTIVLVVMGLP